MGTKSHLATIQLPAHLRERLAQGHPWVYRNHVPPGVRLPTGVWVRLRCGPWSSYALWDADGPIALRVFSEQQIPDAVWMRDRVRSAWNLREPLREGGTTAYRWLFGEGDGLPGLTVDRYGPFAVAAAYSAAAQSLLPQLADALRAVDPSLQGILARLRPEDGDDGQWTVDDRSASTGAGHSRLMNRPLSLLWGAEPPDDIAVPGRSPARPEDRALS
jgi:23S rRNA (cytosine1962-C5)-methyltransferase